VDTTSKRRGLTVIELLAVITIIGILAALALAGYGALVSMARESATRTTLG
jgi:prepilin-type N-terminal cleavage/methylation domain-containing protein